MNHPAHGSRSAGFSLLEIVMVMALLALLASGIFGITVSTFELSAELKDHQDRSQSHLRLIEILEHNFLALPASGQIELKTSQFDLNYVNDLTIYQAPFLFQVANHNRGNVETVVIRTGKGRGGFVRVTLHHLDEEQTKRWQRKDYSVVDQVEPVILADRLRQFEWQFYDAHTRKWIPEWKFRSRRPTLIALNIAREGETQPQSYTFWIPPRHSVSS